MRIVSNTLYLPPKKPPHPDSPLASVTLNIPFYLPLPLQRRRAQNRASQRAFRERKRKARAASRTQIPRLENKHRTLEKSYTDLDSTHAQLKQEVKQLQI